VGRTAPGWSWGRDEGGEAAEEGRNLEVHHRDAEERVPAKPALPRGGFQVSIGTGDDPHIHLLHPTPADRLDLALLECAEEHGLEIEGKLPDLVEHQRGHAPRGFGRPCRTAASAVGEPATAARSSSENVRTRSSAWAGGAATPTLRSSLSIAGITFPGLAESDGTLRLVPGRLANASSPIARRRSNVRRRTRQTQQSRGTRIFTREAREGHASRGTRCRSCRPPLAPDGRSGARRGVDTGGRCAQRGDEPGRSGADCESREGPTRTCSGSDGRSRAAVLADHVEERRPLTDRQHPEAPHETAGAELSVDEPDVLDNVASCDDSPHRGDPT
jgi:hypothetical protein